MYIVFNTVAAVVINKYNSYSEGCWIHIALGSDVLS